MSGGELEFLREAFDSNYIAPLGPMVDAFEREFAEYVGIEHCLALASGTAAMHLALRELGVGPGDEVLASTLTFVGSVSSACFQGASLAFIDSDRDSWCMDVELLAEELAECARRGKLPKAVIPTDLYGQCCDLEAIKQVCACYEIPVVADAAEAMGASYRQKEGRGQRAKESGQWSVASGRRAEDRGREVEGGGQKPEVGIQQKTATPHPTLSPTEAEREAAPRSSLHLSHFHHAGYGAKAAVFSFNGNKIITTSGGGMLASGVKGLIEHARKLSQQARDPAPHYEHSEIGYNYRMSNVLASIGRGQLRVLDQRVAAKRRIFEAYQRLLGTLPGIEFMPEAPYGRCNRWLTVILIHPEAFGATNDQVRLALEAENIEARPVWKPMHLQPVFRGCRIRGGSVSEDLFRLGLCLPSGTAMTDSDVQRVAEIVRRCRR